MPKGFKAGGRQKGTPNKHRKTFIDVLTQGKSAPFKRLINKQVELADGLYVEKEIKDSSGKVLTTVVYKQPPDQKAGQFLLEQTIGKATQAIVVEDPSDKFDAAKYLTA